MKGPLKAFAAITSPAPASLSLAWIDEFWSRAGAYIFCRDLDQVLILPPNRVYRTNETGIRLLTLLKQGYSIQDIKFPSPQAREDTARFFGDLAALYRGDRPVNGTLFAQTYDFQFTQLPVLAELALTYRCNNACRFCYAGCGLPNGTSAAEAQHPEQDTAAYKRIIDIFADQAQVPFFSFTGGEPTLRPDLEELIAYARTKNLVTNLVTNGTLITEERAQALKAAGLGSAQVSVEGPRADVHDSLVGSHSSFDATLRGIAALQRAGIPTQTNTTITRDNIDLIPLMPAFLSGLGVERFAMNLFIPTIPGAEADRLFVAYEEIGALVDRVMKEARTRGMTFFWYSPTPFCSYNPIARGQGNKSCAALDGLLSVAPDGSVLPCSSWDEPLGNVLEQSFREIWFGSKSAFFKEKHFAPQPCKKCPSFVACQGACPLYWRYTKTCPPGLEQLTQAAQSAERSDL
ncbi:MAG: radical SAM protein [Treponema sp.]|nr:radical SAM protein [Treponema sp.]